MCVDFFITLALLATNKTNKDIRMVIISIVMVKKLLFYNSNTHTINDNSTHKNTKIKNQKSTKYVQKFTRNLNILTVPQIYSWVYSTCSSTGAIRRVSVHMNCVSMLQVRLSVGNLQYMEAKLLNPNCYRHILTILLKCIFFRFWLFSFHKFVFNIKCF